MRIINHNPVMLVIVTILCLTGCSSSSSGSGDPEPPPSPPPVIGEAELNTPRKLKAIVASAKSVNLTWQDTSSDEDRFVLERSANGQRYFFAVRISEIEQGIRSSWA